MKKENLQELLLYLTLYMALSDHEDKTAEEVHLYFKASDLHFDVASRIATYNDLQVKS